MHDDIRFASLRGEARKWVEAEFAESEEPWSGRTDDAELEHDGWSPIAPRKRYVRPADFVRAQRVTGSSSHRSPTRKHR